MSGTSRPESYTSASTPTTTIANALFNGAATIFKDCTIWDVMNERQRQSFVELINSELVDFYDAQREAMSRARTLLERAAGWAIKVNAGAHPDANLRKRLIDDIYAFLDNTSEIAP